MRKITVLLFVVAFAFSSNAGIIYVPANSTDNAKVGKLNAVEMLSRLDAQSFLALTPAQRQVKKQLKKGIEVDMMEMAKRANSGSFNWGAAALGFFLGLIGILIVYLAFKNDKEVARKSGWIGFAVGVAVALLLFLL
jgi:hypothetical protein